MSGKKNKWEISLWCLDLDLEIIDVIIRIPYWVTKESWADYNRKMDEMYKRFEIAFEKRKTKQKKAVKKDAKK